MRSLPCFISRKSKNLFLPSLNDFKGGDIMEYITWNDVIQIALLVFAIISCFYNKKR